MMAGNQINITDHNSKKLLRNLEKPLCMDSLPNVLSFIKLIRDHPNGLCFVGPARCGKTTMIENIQFTLMAEKLSSSMGEDEWIKLLLGKISVKIISGRSVEPVLLKYMPPIDSSSEDSCIEEAKNLNPCVVYHFKFQTVHSLKTLNEEIVTESHRVADALHARYPNEINLEEIRKLREKLDSQITVNVVATIASYFRNIDSENTFIFIDDYDVPFYGEYAVESEFHDIRRTMDNFVSHCSRKGYLCLFGSLSFPTKLMTITNCTMFTANTQQFEKFRFLGISKEKAEAYLNKIDVQGYDFKNSHGMLSSISHDIHPLCFHLSVTDRSSLIEICSEMKSCYIILNTLINSSATFQLVSTLYSKGWYWDKEVTESYDDANMVTNFLINNISTSGCLKVLLSLGFVKKYCKCDADDCLDKLGKPRDKLPPKYYSFSNVTLYYSFTYFVKKLYNRRNDRETAGVPSTIFSKFDQAKIQRLCFDFLDRLAIYRYKEKEFVNHVFELMLNVFPAFLVVREFIIEGTNVRPDLGMFSFEDESNSYVWEFKKIDQLQLNTILDEDKEAIHQIYSRKYYEFVQCIDPRIKKKDKLKSRLENMYFITYVTDANKFCYVVIRKYNEKFACDCTTTTTEGCTMKLNKAGYPYLSAELYRTPSSLALSCCGMDPVLQI